MKNNDKKYFKWSIAAHAAILLVLTLNFYFTSPMPVLENTNKNDIISAVVLGDTTKSKILPQKTPAPPKPPEPPKLPEPPKPKTVAKVIPPLPTPKPDVIALKKADDKKKLAAKKALDEKKRHDNLAKDLLADLEKINKKIKKPDPKKMKLQFEKTLREQAEKSLRQQLLDEEIKLQGQQSRQSQGEVNKYKALIIQAISENWIVPPQANKKLFCELMIRIAPGGMVIDVQVTKSSGDPSLDSSARAAVLKSSPLPVPKDANAFESFRQFVLKVKPANGIQA
jgi:colicin import membrane protein